MDTDLLVPMAVAILLSSVKNPAKKAELKKAMMKVFKSVWFSYADDGDFQDLVKDWAAGLE